MRREIRINNSYLHLLGKWDLPSITNIDQPCYLLYLEVERCMSLRGHLQCGLKGEQKGLDKWQCTVQLIIFLMVSPVSNLSYFSTGLAVVFPSNKEIHGTLKFRCIFRRRLGAMVMNRWIMKCGNLQLHLLEATLSWWLMCTRCRRQRAFWHALRRSAPHRLWFLRDAPVWFSP